MVRWTAAIALTALMAARASAQPSPVGDVGGPEEALEKKIAVWRFDALGIEPELVNRLETLFRMELDRLDKVPLPSRRDVERAVTSAEKDCTGEEKCLAAIGKRLGVELVITGTVGSLGDNYVLNIKVVDVATAKSQRIQSDPLKGSPDDLIEGVRVAAYKLLAPEQLHGSVQIQSDLLGASVSIDGRDYGKTPLPNAGVISKLPLGKHKLRVEAQNYDAFEKDIDVHFQKVTPVLVHLLPSDVVGTGRLVREERKPFYTRTWFIVGVGVLAVAAAYAIGSSSGAVPCYINGDMSMPCTK